MASEPQAPVEGLWRQAGYSAAAPARLAAGADGILTVSSPDGATILAEAPAGKVAISSRVGRIPRHVTFPDGGDFETADNDGVDAIERARGTRGVSMAHGLEQFRPRLILFVAATVALAFAIYRYAVPVLVEVAVWAAPPAVTEMMSRSVVTSLDGSVFSPTGLPEERRGTLEQGFRELVKVAGDREAAKPARRNYNLNFRKGGVIGPNAFALPDGTVIVTDELVELAGDDNDLILGVLGHEIGHVERDHSLRQLYRAAGVTALIMLIGGDIGAGTEDVLVQGTALLQLSHSRSAEAEADRFGVELMQAAGKDPFAISRFFEVMRDRLGDTGRNDFFSTHPATGTRIEETRRLAEEAKAGRLPAQ